MIIIEKMTEAHIPAFHRCLDVVARERKYLGFTEAPLFELMEEFVTDCIRNRDPQFIAIERGEVVGWCDIVRNRQTTHLHCGRLGMGVLPSHRRRGLGERLIMRTIVEANRLGIDRIELDVYVNNLAAIGLYRKVGFRAEGMKIKSTLLDGKYIDSMFMALVSVSD